MVGKVGLMSRMVLRAAKMVVGFEVTSASKTRGREEIELGIRGPSCLQELREEGKGIMQDRPCCLQSQIAIRNRWSVG